MADIGPTDETISAETINKVVLLVQEISPRRDIQLSLLTHALVIGCKAGGVGFEEALEAFEQIWDDDHVIEHPSVQ